MKNVIITGGNSGLGFETAKKIAKDRDYRIILACRNAEKAADAKEKIIAETGNENIDTMLLDTSLLFSVRAFADAYLTKYETVDVLINNAGVSAMKANGVTAEGFELVFATNYLGHFLLTQLLLPHFAEKGRIISVSSDMHNPPGGIEWKSTEYLAHEAMEDRSRYSHAKLCVIYFTLKLDELLRAEGSSVTANSFNPGFMMATNFMAGGPGGPGGPGAPGGGRPAQAHTIDVKTAMPDRYGEVGTSSDALAQIATDSQFDGVSGQYFDRSINTAASSELSYNRENREELWVKSLEYCGL